MSDDFRIGDEVFYETKPHFRDHKYIEHGIITYLSNEYMFIHLYDNVSVTAKKKKQNWYAFRQLGDYTEKVFKKKDKRSV